MGSVTALGWEVRTQPTAFCPHKGARGVLKGAPGSGNGGWSGFAPGFATGADLTPHSSLPSSSALYKLGTAWPICG